LFIIPESLQPRTKNLYSFDKPGIKKFNNCEPLIGYRTWWATDFQALTDGKVDPVQVVPFVE
jgi:hypothetical protein